jgi:hypothetical protein
MKKLFSIVLAATFVCMASSLHAQEKDQAKAATKEEAKDKTAAGDKAAAKDKAEVKDKTAVAADAKGKAAATPPQVPANQKEAFGYFINPQRIFFFAVLITAIMVIWLFWGRKKTTDGEQTPPNV